MGKGGMEAEWVAVSAQAAPATAQTHGAIPLRIARRASSSSEAEAAPAALRRTPPARPLIIPAQPPVRAPKIETREHFVVL
jgi:hypothetical protein